jgi:exodeoxyribonuclease VII large subunit
LAVYTVGQVTAYLREILEVDPFLSDLYVVGEVSNLRVSGAGHSYFTLKDSDGVLNCVMFRGQPGADLLVEGGAVSTHGHLSFYQPRGTTDFMVDLAMPEGVGELALELERLKQRLEAEGLFQESRKRPLPLFPHVVGVVTSPAGAVFHDIQNVIRRRYPLVELALSPTTVQGDGAAPQIVAALERLERDGRSDVIIVARGGGSLEELWPFNEEIVARAIYSSRIPVVSAVGHETDVTISDLVADVRAPTPSAAAELVVPDGWGLRQELLDLSQRLLRAARLELQSHRNGVEDMRRRLANGLPDLETRRRQVDDMGRSMRRSLEHHLSMTRVEVTGLEHRLRTLDPAATLARGFSIVQRAGETGVVTAARQVSDGDALTITLAEGTIPATAGPHEAAAKSQAPARKRRKPTPAPNGMERLF